MHADAGAWNNRPATSFSYPFENPHGFSWIRESGGFREAVRIRMEKEKTAFRMEGGEPVTVRVYGREYRLGTEELTVPRED